MSKKNVYKTALVALFEKYDPECLPTVQDLLNENIGKEDALLRALTEKYAKNSSSKYVMDLLIRGASESNDANTEKTNLADAKELSPVNLQRVEVPIEEAPQKESPYREEVDEASVNVSPIAREVVHVPEKIESPNPVEPERTESYRDQLLRIYATYSPTRVVNVDRELEKYEGKEDELIEAALTRYCDEERPKEPTDEDYRNQIIKLYQTYAPSKMHKVEFYLQKYKGREKSLLSAVENKLLKQVDQAMRAQAAIYDFCRAELLDVYRQYAPQRLSRVDRDLRKYPGREKEVVQAAIKKFAPKDDLNLSTLGMSFDDCSFVESETNSALKRGSVVADQEENETFDHPSKEAPKLEEQKVIAEPSNTGSSVDTVDHKSDTVDYKNTSTSEHRINEVQPVPKTLDPNPNPTSVTKEIEDNIVETHLQADASVNENQNEVSDSSTIAAADEHVSEEEEEEADQKDDWVNAEYSLQYAMVEYFSILGVTTFANQSYIERPVCELLWNKINLDPSKMCEGDVVSSQEFFSAVKACIPPKLSKILKITETMNAFVSQCREMMIKNRNNNFQNSSIRKLEHGFWVHRSVRPAVIPSWKRCWATLSGENVLKLCVPNTARSQMELSFDRIENCQLHAMSSSSGAPKQHSRNGLLITVTRGPDPLEVLLCTEEVENAHALSRAYKKWKKTRDETLPSPSPSPARAKSVSMGATAMSTTPSEERGAGQQLSTVEVWCCRFGKQAYVHSIWSFAHGALVHYPAEDARVTFMWDFADVEEVVRMNSLPVTPPLSVKQTCLFVIRRKGGKDLFCCVSSLRELNFCIMNIKKCLLRRQVIPNYKPNAEYPNKVPGRTGRIGSCSTTQSMNSSVLSSCPTPLKRGNPTDTSRSPPPLPPH